MNTENLTDFRRQAQKITLTGKPAKMVWSELNNWASCRGPLAMKSAVIEFVNAYRGSSELSVLMPELMRSHIFSPYEKKAFVELAEHKVNLTEYQPDISLRPKLFMPAATSKPELALFLNPKTGSSILRSEFTIDPREAIFSFKEKTQISFNRPNLPERKLQNQFDLSILQSHSLAFDSKASHGEVLLRNLVEHVKSHNADPISKFKTKFKTKTRHKATKLAVKLKLNAKVKHRIAKVAVKRKISKKIKKKTRRR